MDEPLTKAEALETLTMLCDLPVWLAGGIGADFHVGRWTRDHHDVDLVAFEDDHGALFDELTKRGFVMTHDDLWISRWTRRARHVGEVSLAILRRVDDSTGDLVITPEGSRGGRITTGVFPGVPGNLDVDAWRTLEGVRFRVCSAEDEWVYTHSFSASRPGARLGATDRHNLALLEEVLSEEERERLRPLIGRHRPLEEIDAQSE